MRSLIASILVFAALMLSCGDSATEITGTLPVVTGITVDSVSSKGDTIVVIWNELTGTQIEGYFVWFKVRIEDPWMLLNTVNDAVAIHIADRSAFYTVMGYDGTNTSSDIGLSDNTRAENLSEMKQPASVRPMGFRIDTEGDSIVSGDPSSPDFHQQFTIKFDELSGERFIFPGASHPELWPGGVKTMVSSIGGFVAPALDDSISWQDSIFYGGDFFLALENGYFCRLDGLITVPDTSSLSDTLVISGQLQPMTNVRVFNQTW